MCLPLLGRFLDPASSGAMGFAVHCDHGRMQLRPWKSTRMDTKPQRKTITGAMEKHATFQLFPSVYRQQHPVSEKSLPFQLFPSARNLKSKSTNVIRRMGGDADRADTGSRAQTFTNRRSHILLAFLFCAVEKGKFQIRKRKIL